MNNCTTNNKYIPIVFQELEFFEAEAFSLNLSKQAMFATWAMETCSKWKISAMKKSILKMRWVYDQVVISLKIALKLKNYTPPGFVESRKKTKKSLGLKRPALQPEASNQS
jgi:hypothetical protein